MHTSSINEDPRLDYFLSAIASASGVLASTLLSRLVDSRPIERFLDDERCSLVVASYDATRTGSDSLTLHNSIDQIVSKEESAILVAFLKHPDRNDLSQCNAEEIKSVVCVVTIPRAFDIVATLRTSLHSLYAPALLGSDSGNLSQLLPEKTKSLLHELNKELAAVAMLSKADSNDVNSFLGIRTPTDETDFWTHFAGDRTLVSAAAQISVHLKEASTAWGMVCGNASSGSAPDFEALAAEFGEGGSVDNALYGAYHVVTEDGRPVYQTERMGHFMGVIAIAFCKHIRQSLQPHQALFTSPFLGVRVLLNKALASLDAFTSMLTRLTTIDFVVHNGQKWDGPPFSSIIAGNLGERLQSILGTRSTHQEMLGVLSPEQREQLTALNVLEPLAAIDPTNPSPYVHQRIEDAVQAVEAKMSVADEWAIDAIKEKLSPNQESPLLLLTSLEKVSNLIKRPRIALSLSSYIRDLVDGLEELLDVMERRIDDIGDSSSQVDAVLKCRRYESKAKQIIRAMKTVDASDDNISALCSVIADKCKLAEDSMFETWVDDTICTLQSDRNVLELKGSLIEIDKDGVLRVNFDDALTKMIREERQFTELGFVAPDEIKKSASKGQNFLSLAIKLRRVASFYNSVENYIIPEQRAMVLDKLLAFEEVINSQGGGKSSSSTRGVVTWNRPSDCERFVEKLHRAAADLKRESSKLKKMHGNLAKLTDSLCSCDLLTKKPAWMQLWGEIQGIMTDAAAIYDPKRMAKWVTHWNKQLFKALESNFQLGLQRLHENIGELRCDLVFDKDVFGFSPDLPTLRADYYDKMKAFIEFPGSKFRGINNSGIFSDIAPRNSSALASVYDHAKDIFARLEGLLEQYSSWQTLRSSSDASVLNMKETCELNDFATSFEGIKTRRTEIGKLPSVEVVGAVKVSLRDFVALLEDDLCRLHDSIAVGLQRNILGSYATVDEYLTSSIAALTTAPSTMEQIMNSQEQWKSIVAQKMEMHGAAVDCREKTSLLRQHASESSTIAMDDLQEKMLSIDRSKSSRWSRLEQELDAFAGLVETQKDAICEALAGDAASLRQQIMEFATRWQGFKPPDIKKLDKSVVVDALAKLENLLGDFASLQVEIGKLTERFAKFDMEEPDLGNVDELTSDVDDTRKVWQALREYSLELEKLGSSSWIDFRANVYLIDDFRTKWVDKLKTLSSSSSHEYVKAHILEEVDMLGAAVPVLRHCRGEDFKEDHWSELLQGKMRLSGSVTLESLTCRHFLQSMHILVEPGTLKYIKNLQTRAQGEVQVRGAMQELVAWTKVSEVKLHEHESAGRRTSLIEDFKSLLLDIGDNQSLLASLKESPFFKSFADAGKTYDDKMLLLDQCLRILNVIQRKWVYLEPIFLRNALPSEKQRFCQADESFRSIMKKVQCDPRLFDLVDVHVHPELMSTLSAINDQLDRCQRALSAFLEEKRTLLPRFYFVGDDDLLEILGRASDPLAVQNHYRNLFQALHRVSVDDNGCIVSFESSEGEAVDLEMAIEANGGAESWLGELALQQQQTLAALLSRCLDKFPSGPGSLARFPSQILCAAENTCFAKAVEDSFDAYSGLDALDDALLGKLKKLTQADKSSDPVLRSKTRALVLDIIHNRDILDQLMQNGARRKKDWAWQKQLKYYAPQVAGGKTLCSVEMSGASLDYSFEYQGNQPKLVHTPLTDRCYLNLMQAMRFGFGGSPFGPAGTGKTETVKALGAALGRQVLVFNCDEGIDFTSMGRMFRGVVMSGAWGCFDEFNRLRQEDLSAISQQIQTIQDAIKAKDTSVELVAGATATPLNLSSAIFVTMNPAGKGYGGRSILPANLKSLFRPIAMGRPDKELIAEVTLFSEGFLNGKELGKQVVTLYNLAEQSLSSQLHYDWGLRALKAVLRTASKLLSQRRDAGDEHVAVTEEAQILVKALRMNTLSKLTGSDLVLFNQIISDVFVEIPTSKASEVGELETTILEVMQAKPFCFNGAHQSEVTKIMQLKEQLDQRTGCAIVGASGSGKSTMWRVLESALQKRGERIITYVLNPKAISRAHLLGELDRDTRQFSDGVLIDAVRQAVREPTDSHIWIVCDGQIDPEWIEALNSVLDDNRLLTLPNGERLPLGSNINLIFETSDVSFASPATISRLGIIFCPQDRNVSDIVSHLLRTVDEDPTEELSGLIDKFFFKALELSEKYAPVVDATLIGTIRDALSHIACSDASEQHFLQRLIRGFGSNMSLASRDEFSKTVLSWSKENAADDIPLNHQVVTVDNGTILTKSSHSLLADIRPWVENEEPFVVCGPQGCGKETSMRHAFSVHSTRTKVESIRCSELTKPRDIIALIKSTCCLFTSKGGQAYRPRNGKLVVLIKDIDAAATDKYGTCMLQSFLQHVMTYGGFYDENLEFYRVENVQIVCSMTGSRNKLDERLASLVRIAATDLPDSKDLAGYCSELLFKAFSGKERSALPAAIKSDADRLEVGVAMAEIFASSARLLSKASGHSHDVFTLRTLQTFVDNLVRYGNQASFARCFRYETSRQFSDLLVSEADRSEAVNVLDSVLRKSRVFTVEEDARASGYFSALGANDCTIPVPDGVPLSFLPRDSFKGAIEKALALYQREETEVRVTVSPQALDILSQMEHCLARPGGHLMLIGRCGVGRRTFTKIACFIHQIRFDGPLATVPYGIGQFQSQLKKSVLQTGVNEESTCLFLEDYHASDPSILALIHRVLSGELKPLFSDGELEQILVPLQEKIAGDDRYSSPYDYFAEKVAENLRMVLSIDETSSALIGQCALTPAISTCCKTLWIGTMPSSCLKQVCSSSEGLRQIMSSQTSGESQVMSAIIAIHASADSLGATPKDFKNLLSVWEHCCHAKERSIKDKLHRLDMGVEKLSETKAAVGRLRKEARLQQEELQLAQAQADKAMKSITTELAKSQVKRTEIENLKTLTAEKTDTATTRKAAIEKELSEIQPLLDEAKEAVKGIKKEHLGEIKSLKTPPAAISDVLQGVMMLLNIKDLSWFAMRKWLGQRGFKEDILNFDAGQLSPHHAAQVEALVKRKSKSFEKASIARVSVAAAPLAAWVVANLKYSAVMEQVKPLRDGLDAAQGELVASKERLQSCEEDLAQVDEIVESLMNDFAARTGEAEVFKSKLERAESRLGAAQTLLGQLGGEYERWSDSSKILTRRLSMLPLQALLWSALSVYAARLSDEGRRDKYLTEWLRIVKDLTGQDVDVEFGMIHEIDRWQWRAWGLPDDTQSQQKAFAVSILPNDMVPFIIDAEGVAANWLKNHLSSGEKQVEVVSITDERFSSRVMTGVKFGKALIIRCDGIDPYLYPLIRREATPTSGGSEVVQLGDKLVDVHEDFRLVLMTRQPEPQVAPAIRGSVIQIDFSVSSSGLENRLLGLVTKNELPQLEQRKQEITKEEEEKRIELANLENTLLDSLNESEGGLLENKILLRTLEKSKESAKVVGAALEESIATGKVLDEQRNVYRDFCRFGSRLFFLLSQMHQWNHFYRFSLSGFETIFTTALADPRNAVKDVKARLDRLEQSLLAKVIAGIGRSIFKADLPAFALQLVHGMYPGPWGESDWQVFTGVLTAHGGEARGLGFPSWAASEQKMAFATLAKYCARIIQDVDLDSAEWEKWGAHPQCGRCFPPACRLSAVERLLLVQALRPDVLMAAVSEFCCSELSIKSLSDGSTLNEIRNDNLPRSLPIMFVTKDSDPSKDLEVLAAEAVGSKRYRAIALGGGHQRDLALQMLRNAADKGYWVCLKNLHLDLGWIPDLEKEIAKLELANAFHSDFRLWLMTELNDGMPSSLLERCAKIAYEAPPGISSNVHLTYSALQATSSAMGSSAGNKDAMLLLAWLHSLVQERKSYGYGWKKAHEFGSGDLRAGAYLVNDALTKSKKKRFDALQNLVETCVYGGRMDDVHDQRVLRAYVEKLFNEDVLSGAVEFAPGLRVPPAKTSDPMSHQKIIGKIFNEETPSLIGLPANVGQALEKTKGERLMKQLQAIEIESKLRGFCREDWAASLEPAIDFWENLKCSHGVQVSSLLAVTDRDDSDCDGDAAPIVIFFRNEHHFGSQLFEIMDTTMSNLAALLRGNDIPDESIIELGNFLSARKTPEEWRRAWDGPEKLFPYMSGVVRRLVAAEQVNRTCSNENMLLNPQDLSSMFSPLGFLGAMRQSSARAMKRPMHDLKLTASWRSSTKKFQPSVHPHPSVTVEGLKIQGAQFDGSSLKDVSVRDPTFAEVPEMVLSFAEPDSFVGSDNTIEIPCFVTSAREDLLMEIRVPCRHGDINKWILSGAFFVVDED